MPAFFTDKYSMSQVRTEIGVAVENVILGDQNQKLLQKIYLTYSNNK